MSNRLSDKDSLKWGKSRKKASKVRITKRAKKILDVLRSRPATISQIAKITGIDNKRVWEIIERLLESNKAKIYGNPDVRIKTYVSYDFDEETSKIENTILKMLPKEYYIRRLETPRIEAFIGKEKTIFEIFKFYDIVEKVKFNRKEKLMLFVADKLGYDENNQAFRDKFAKIYSSLVFQ